MFKFFMFKCTYGFDRNNIFVVDVAILIPKMIWYNSISKAYL